MMFKYVGLIFRDCKNYPKEYYTFLNEGYEEIERRMLDDGHTEVVFRKEVQND